MIDKNYLKEGYSTNKKDGYYAEFYENGQIKFFGYFKNNSADDWWVLTISENGNEGNVIIKNGSGGTSDSESNKNGIIKKFDSWSDNQDIERIDFDLWVKKWIERIYRADQKDTSII